ncbi:hypothetical protein [Streptomyces sp. NPDC047108]|uniref:hypothetical protein n=1 Tax=Streptomyces sp. NPDC047108 TaxID=3155025 RepID=UPI0034023799
MTDTSISRTATQGTWALPLLALAPLAAIRLLTELSTPWLAISWVFCILSVLLVAAAWTTVFRHGSRGIGTWGTCILVHAVLAWQLIALVRN